MGNCRKCDNKRRKKHHCEKRRCHKKCSCDSIRKKNCERCKCIIENFAPATYKLVKRTLPSGVVQSGPGVTGTISFSKNGHRVMSLAIDNGDGTFFSVGLQTTYSIDCKVFKDKLVALVLNVGEPTDPTIYNFSPISGEARVRCENGVVVIKNPPIDPLLELRFTETSFTAVSPTGVVDFWIRVD